MMLRAITCWLILILNFPLCWAQIQFQDISSTAGIAYPGNKNHGLLFADYDNDGDEDIYVLSRLNENALFENQGDGTFKNVAPLVGLNLIGSARAGVWGDINNDGWIDLYVGINKRLDILFLNNGPNESGQVTFINISLSAGINNFSEPRSVHMTDLDQDGFLDIYVANYRDENRIYHNQGNLMFVDKMAEWQIDGNDFSLGCIFFDYDKDGDDDLYLAHDFLGGNILHQNNGKGRFRDVTAESNTGFVGHGMGVDVADVNHDGWLDMYLTDLHANLFYLNQQDGSFKNIALEAGVGDLGMGWSCMFLDADNDSWVDMYVVNESSFFPQPNVLFQNQGDLSFEPIDLKDPISSKLDGVGGAFADVNQDGYPDIVVANTFAAAGNQLFENQTSGNHWIGFQLEGTSSNRSAIGARIEIEYDGGQLQTDQVIAGSGYASQNTLKCYFGLGTYAQADVVRIFWPGGLTESYSNLAGNKVHHLVENAATAEQFIHIFPPAPNPFQEVTSFKIELKEQSHLSIYITDLNGRKLHQFFEGEHGRGILFFDWHPQDLPAGTYILWAEKSDKLPIYRKIRKLPE